jgi:hypothetical protein
MASLDKYRSARLTDEIALARSAAPAFISNHAEILVLGLHGYDVAVKGTNGFVCIVERAWSIDVDSPEFWDPKLRGPLCLNAAAARSVLPEYLMRTQWVLSGATREQVAARIKAAVASNKITAPETGSMCYMQSKYGYLNERVAGPWHPHLMFFLPPTAAAQWGANEPGSPVAAAVESIEPITVFMVPIAKWSDGTLDRREPTM